MKNTLKRIKFLIVIALSLFICGCQAKPVKNFNTVKQTDKYNIVECNNDLFIEIKDDDILNRQSQIGELVFTSIDEFLDKIENGFDDVELTVINSFKKDERGLIKVFNYTNPLYPSCSGFEVSQFFWGGESYSYYLEGSGSSFAYLHFCDEQSYVAAYERLYSRFFDGDQIEVTDVQRDENQCAVYYFKTSVATFKSIRYELTDGTTTKKVDEIYVLSSNVGGIACSSTIPYKVRVFSEDGFFYYEFHKLDNAFKTIIENSSVTQYSQN